MGSHGAGDPAELVMIGLRRIVRFLRLAERAAGSGYGLSAAQLFVLRVLVDAPARSIAEIATRTLTDQSSVSTVVARLVAKKLVRRKMVTTDRRRAELVLTTTGLRIATNLSRLPQVAIVEAVRAMPIARQANLVRTLAELTGAIGADVVSPRMLFEDEFPPERRGRR
jgi:DNA-binding MarR family transcriptional regulator